MPASPLRVSLAGPGNMGRRHLEALFRIPAVEVTSIVCQSDSKAAQLKRLYGVPVLTSFEAFADDLAADLLVIATPTEFHSLYLRLAISEGIAAFVEKPYVESADKAEYLTNEWEAHGKPFLQVGHCLLYDAAIEAGLSAVQQGLIGNVQEVQILRSGPVFEGVVPRDQEEPDWMYEQLIHQCGLITGFLPGCDPQEITYGHRDMRPGRERLSAKIVFSQRTRATIEITPEGDAPHLELTLTGSQGSLRLITGRNPVATLTGTTEQKLPVQRGNLFQKQMRDVVRRVQSGKPPLSGPMEGLRAMLWAKTLVT